MTSSSDRLKFAGFTLLMALGVALAYTVLHESGHALAGLAFGGKIREIDVNFLNLGAHVNIEGSFSRFQNAVINFSGAGLPLLVWLILILALPKESGPLVLWTKFIASAGTLCSLLAWVVIPIFYLSNDAPAGDDVTRFLANSGLPTLSVAFGALAIFTGGWFLFFRRSSGTRPVWHVLFTGAGKPVSAWRWVLAGGVVVAALVAAGILVVSTFGNGLPALPKGYNLAVTVDLSARDMEAETIARFDLPTAGDVVIFLRVTGLDTRLIDMSLVPSQGESIQLMHGEDFASAASDSQNQYRLQAGEYGIVLTNRKSSGILQVYFCIP